MIMYTTPVASEARPRPIISMFPSQLHSLFSKVLDKDPLLSAFEIMAMALANFVASMALSRLSKSTKFKYMKTVAEITIS